MLAGYFRHAAAALVAPVLNNPDAGGTLEQKLLFGSLPSGLASDEIFRALVQAIDWQGDELRMRVREYEEPISRIAPYLFNG